MIEKKASALQAWLLANYRPFAGYQIDIFLMGIVGTFQLRLYRLGVERKYGMVYETDHESLEQVLDDAIEYLHIQVSE